MLKDLTLISEKFEADEMLNDVPLTDERTLPAEIQSATRQEFFAAAKEGMRPEFVAKIFYLDYQGEQKARMDGETFKVYRAFTDYEAEQTELYLERVTKDVKSN